MDITNPFAAAGWYNLQAGNNELGLQNPSDPPTFGALPNQGQSSSSWVFVFHMSNYTTLNSVVLGPRNLRFFEVQTTGGRTVMSKYNGPVARVQWGASPTLEILTGNAMVSHRAGSFLRLSDNAMYRTMQIGEKSYTWLKHQSGDYVMCSPGTVGRDTLAEIRRSSDGRKVTLTMRGEAFSQGLLEPCAIATVLLFSGLDLD